MMIWMIEGLDFEAIMAQIARSFLVNHSLFFKSETGGSDGARHFSVVRFYDFHLIAAGPPFIHIHKFL